MEHDDSEYRAIDEVAAMLRCRPRTLGGWIKGFGLGVDHGVIRSPVRYLIDWPLFREEFLKKIGTFTCAGSETGDGQARSLMEPSKYGSFSSRYLLEASGNLRRLSPHRARMEGWRQATRLAQSRRQVSRRPRRIRSGHTRIR